MAKWGSDPMPWDLRRLKTVAELRTSNVDKNSSEGEQPVRLCNYTDVYYSSEIDNPSGFMKATATQDEIRRFRLRRGDVLITKDSETPDDIAVPAHVARDFDDILCGYHLAILRPRNELVGKFLYYALLTNRVRDQFTVGANGITRFGLGQSIIKGVMVPVPDINAQNAIASFLNRETIRIDSLIEKKRRLLDLLDEKRTALINRAVTCGLDPDVPMKYSGVEWIGEIPEHWDVTTLGRVTASRCDGPFGSSLKSDDYVPDGVRVIRLQNIGSAAFKDEDKAYIAPDYYSGLGDHTVKSGDLLIAGLGDDRHPAGRACVAPSGIEPAMVKADCFRYRIKRHFAEPDFLALQLSITAPAASAALSSGATRTRINLSATSARAMVLPPLVDQRRIVERIGRAVEASQEIAKNVQKAVELLQEYRIALISAAVMGKIEVRQNVGTRAG